MNSIPNIELWVNCQLGKVDFTTYPTQNLTRIGVFTAYALKLSEHHKCVLLLWNGGHNRAYNLFLSKLDNHTQPGS